MDHAKTFQSFEESEINLEFYSRLAQAMEDVKQGRTQTLDKAINDVVSELDNLTI